MATLPFFLDIAGAHAGRRFCVLHEPAGSPPRGLVLHLPAFGEEMNKSRRMVSQQSRRLAAQGFAVLQVDLLGCGDSDGDHAEATLDAWADDLACAAHWLQQRHAGTDTLWLWAHRAGALLLDAVAARLATPANILAWQPVLSGRWLLNHWLRLGAAASLGDVNAKGHIEQLRARLAQGQAIEVAGYGLGAAWCEQLAAIELRLPVAAPPARLCWIELGTDLPPAAAKLIDAYRSAGWQVQARAAEGPRFWQTTEIEDAADLWRATCELLADDPPARPVQAQGHDAVANEGTGAAPAGAARLPPPTQPKVLA